MVVSVIVVTFNSARFLQRTLDGAAAQEGLEIEIVIVDNASTDDSAAIARSHPAVSRVIANGTNEGFCRAQNSGITSASGDVVLCLNPDVMLAPDFVVSMVPRLRGEYGFATGRLIRADAATGEPTTTLDSTGLFFLRNRRHVDRGAGEPDDGRYRDAGDVGGATGAALLARRDAFEAVTPPGHDGPFDAAFFTYREDADLAWRAQILGWRCWYEPEAVGHHVRGLRPERPRRAVGPEINMHSVKNRYLMLVKNETWRGLRPDVGPFLGREALITGGVLLRERSSLAGYPLLARALPRACRDRLWIQRHRQVPASAVRDRLFLT